MSQYQHIVNVEGAVKKDDRLLTVIRSEVEDHAAGTLSFIGGKVEFTHRQPSIIEATVKREILEEVGVEVGNIKYVTSTAFFTDDGRSVVNMVFVCDWESGEARAIDPDEVASVHWMTLDEIRNHAKTPPWILEYTDLIDNL
jgi:8-oxo-dGTP diphosphatase